MTRLAWATDLHFEFATVADVVTLCEAVLASDVTALLLTGDIAQARSVERYLRALDRALPLPIYFVLGNHDFYHGSIQDVRAAVAALAAQSAHLVWMSRAEAVTVAPGVALVGHDGWADARCGDYGSSRVLLNDYRLIRELTGLTTEERRQALQALGDEAVAHFRQVLPDALARHRRVIALTHVPPFPEATLYRGRIADPEWLPHFCAGALGNALIEIMDAHAGQELLVLCGHTHTGGTVQVRPNLTVMVGTAEYGRPRLQQALEIPDDAGGG